MVLTWTRSNRG